MTTSCQRENIDYLLSLDGIGYWSGFSKTQVHCFRTTFGLGIHLIEIDNNYLDLYLLEQQSCPLTVADPGFPVGGGGHRAVGGGGAPTSYVGTF